MPYEVLHWLGATAGRRLARARERGGGPLSERFLLELLDEPVTPEILNLLRRELELARALAGIPGVLRPIALEENGPEPMLVLEDQPGEPLEVLLASGVVPKTRALRLALRLAQLVARLHDAHVIHRQLSPPSLLVGAADELWLLGLSRATRWSEPERVPATAVGSVADLAYISPEQTGRMNRSVDLRSDLYAVGVILYRLFSGELPFRASDPLGWVHAHLARTPPPLDDPALSAIVLRLLAKQPEDRYQNARGLALDLARCVEEWDAGRALTPFIPGQHDAPARFQSPQKLYGREAELDALLDVHDRVTSSGSAELALVAGYSGVGKSSLIQGLRRRIPADRASFISGKFDPLRSEVPYSTFTTAFRDLVFEILAGDDEQISASRGRVSGAVGANGRLITDLIPEVELLIGPQPAIPTLPPTEAQNRFRVVFAAFAGAVAGNDRALVLFLDDLQWADAASLELVSTLLVDASEARRERSDRGRAGPPPPAPSPADPVVRSMLVLGAYRDNEVGPEHPLHRVVDALTGAGVVVTRFSLGPLDCPRLTSVIADGLDRQVADCAALGDLVYQKTAGNPFFSIRFLTELCDERLISFDPSAGRFSWDLAEIRAKELADNVVELLIGRLRRLPRRTQLVLERLACVGNRADLSLLAHLEAEAEDAVAAAVEDAARAGLLTSADGACSFAHDRVREAAYALLDPADRAEVHLRIARRWTARASKEALEEHVFDLAGQWNRGAELVIDPEERATLARLNALAGGKAKAAVAYGSARVYFAHAAAHLPPTAWDTDAEGTLTLHLELAECEYLAGEHARAEELLDLASSRVRSPIDAARIDSLRMRLYQLAGRQPEATRVMLQGLGRFGVEFPDTDAEIEAASALELARMADLVRGRRIADFVDAPDAADPGVHAAIALLDEGLAAVYTARPALWPLAALRLASLSVERGHADGSAYGYIAYAVVLSAMTGDRKTAFAFSEMALRLNERRETRTRLAGKLLFHHAAMVHHWCRPFASSLRLMDEAFPACIEVGELVYAGYLTYNRVWALLESGASLARVSAAVRDDLAFATKWHNDLVSLVLRAEGQMIACLQGGTLAPPGFDDASFCEAESITALERAGFNVGLAFFYVMKQVAEVVYGRFSEARESGRRASQFLRAVTGLLAEPTHHFYHALTVAALHDDAPPAERPALARALADELARHERWAEDGPANFGHRRALIAAELARIEGRDADAQREYDEAVRLAVEQEILHAEALAWETAARYYRSRGRPSMAAACTREARSAYARWGAAGKAAELDRSSPALAARSADAESVRKESLDLPAVLAASQAISREIELGGLVVVLMRVILAAAGAQVGWLVHSREGRLSLAAKATVDDHGVAVELSAEGSPPEGLPLSILNCVRRSRERILLDDATEPSPFASDPALASGAKSVLCLPILHQSELIALLHLENRLVTNAFGPARVAVLEVLAAQAAISLQNARLYADVRRENAERQLAEEAVKEGQALLQAIVDHAPALIHVKDLEGRYLLVNHHLAETLGREPAAILGKTDYELLARALADAQRSVDLRVSGGSVVECEVADNDGGRVFFEVKAPLTDAAGRIYATCGIATDITERKRADAALRRTEEQLRQAQKMEAIGNLAGGVAHDFNNLLTVILSYGTLLAQDMGQGDRRRADLEEIIGAAQRAADLTRQLLAFGRKQILQPRVINLNDCVAGIEKMLRRLIGEDIELAFVLAPQLGSVLVDPGQAEQIVVNLAVNSRDAMPAGGKLTIETANVELDERYAAEHLGVSAGPHVMLAVSDTGVGMDAATQARMFEPFFTTKGQGRGTGLGLATVFGIVRQSGGHIWVYSEVGEGTAIKSYFPRVSGVATEARAPAPTLTEVGGGNETVLLVEDDERVRALVRTILARLGYHVLEAQSGGDALLISEQHPATIDLLLTDVVMPRLSGRQLAERLSLSRPSMRVLYMSGYTDNSIVHHGVLDSGVAFLEKPITPEKLARKVREVLDCAPRPPGS